MLENTSSLTVNKKERNLFLVFAGVFYLVATMMFTSVFLISGFDVALSTLTTPFSFVKDGSVKPILFSISVLQVIFFMIGCLLFSMAIKSNKDGAFLTEKQLVEFKNLLDGLGKSAQSFDVRFFISTIEEQNRIPVYGELVSLRQFFERGASARENTSDLNGNSRFSVNQKSLWKDIRGMYGKPPVTQ